MSDPGTDNREDSDENDLPEDYVPSGEIENGHISESSNSHSEESDNSEEQPVASSSGQYNTDLPTVHRYLGKLSNVRGYTLYDDGDVINNILAIYTNTMVFPGFTLPLIMNSYSEVNTMENYLKNTNVFVLLCSNSSSTGVFGIGVTMEIFETEARTDAVSIKARGRQRCKLMPECDLNFWNGRLKYVNVKIIAEPPITSPLCDTQMLTLKQKRLLTSTKFSDIIKNYKFRRYHLTQYPLPPWVYDNYEVSYFVEMLLNCLSHYVGEYIPRDPVLLSYWFVQNYQLSHDERLHILNLNTAVERLKLECRFVKEDRKMCCVNCNMEISDASKVFAMSKDGIQSNYVNPGGHVYETVTVLEAKNFNIIGSPSKEFSWFPGYAWTILQCTSCNAHLGWEFTNRELKPKLFYGLAKSCFKIVIPPKLPSESEIQELFDSRRITYTRNYIP